MSDYPEIVVLLEQDHEGISAHSVGIFKEDEQLVQIQALPLSLEIEEVLALGDLNGGLFRLNVRK